MTTHTMVWPSGPLDVDHLAHACAAVAAAAEEGSFTAIRIADLAAGASLTPAVFLDRHRDRFVITTSACTQGEFVAMITGNERSDLPFSFAVCPNGFALIHSHELGDGTVSAALLEAVLHAYADDDGLPSVPGRAARNRDLAQALGALWLRRPRSIVDTAVGITRQYRRRPAMGAVSQIRAASGVRLETWAVNDDDVAALDRWRHRWPRRPSMSIALLWTIARVLAAQGYPYSPQPWQVMIGMRGSTPELTDFGGNLVGRALVDVDPAGDPAVATGLLRRQSSSGEIIALHLAKAGARRAAGALQRLRGGAPKDPSSVQIGNTPGLSWSDRSRHAFGRGFTALIPSTAADGRTLVPYVYTIVTPGLDGIGLNVNWTGNRAGVVLSFGASPLDDLAVDGVIRLLHGGIARLLDTGETSTATAVD